MDVNWCLRCGRQTNDWNDAYCSKMCLKLDTHHSQSLPISLPSRRRSFELPSLSPPHRPAHFRRAGTRLSTSVGVPFQDFPSKARFADDELQDGPSTSAAPRWTGKGRAGILVWAHAVAPGLDEDDAPADSASVSDVAVLATLRFSARPPPFPLTVQNLAPPCVTRHVLLSHTAQHPASVEDPTLPALSPDDSSLLNPTESVITPSLPDSTSRRGAPLVSRLVSKVFPAWGAAPKAPPPADAEAASLADKSDASYMTRSSAIQVCRATANRPRVNSPGSGRLYDI